jgi:predicted ATP-grasp superfamily ATP-dependent carboligase
MSCRNVLVLSATASAINVIRSLQHDPDIKLFVSDVSRYASGLYQSNVTPILVPAARASEQYCVALDCIIAEDKIDIIIPTSDRDVEGVVTLLSRGWDPEVAMFRPSYEAHRLLSDKWRLARHLRACGLPAPATWQDLNEATFPAVIKPLREGGGKGVAIVRDCSEAKEAVGRLQKRYGPDFLIQEYVPGGAGSVYVSLMLFDPNGGLIANTVMRSSLTYFTWGGGGNAGSIVDDAEIESVSRQIIEASGGWRGPLNLEFKRNSETGRLFLFEANCRLNGYSYLTTMNGMNYPRAMVELLSHPESASISLNPPPVKKNFVLGFREKLIGDWVASSTVS